MGLTSSMWSGVSGLLAHGEKMGVIGNDLSNVSTVGYKGSTMHFEDMISQDISTSSGVSQVGRGVRISAVYTDFTQGSFETTTESTDVAISGNGFFVVRNNSTNNSYYTRAGNFRFNDDGYLVDTHGNVVQGFPVTTTADNKVATTGEAGDVKLESFQANPKATSSVNLVVNLNSEATSKTTSSTAANASSSLFEAWNGGSATPMSSSSYSYQSTMKVYDANGGAHDMTVYFDKVNDSSLTNDDGKIVWEYLVTVPPSDDHREVTNWGATSSKKGVLMAGTLSFTATGELEGMTAYTLQGNADASNAANWTLAQLGADGYPLAPSNFSGSTGASFGSAAGNLAINFGIGAPGASGTWTGGSTLAALGTNYATYPKVTSQKVAATATTSHNSSSATLTQQQNGYASGLLSSIEIDADGVIIGKYSNSTQKALGKLTMASFTCEWGLRREGMNLYSATRASGDAMTGEANTGLFGSINSYSLEQSNVDMSKEMVEMILTQRGFQANSKTITTADTLLGEVIQLKR